METVENIIKKIIKTKQETNNYYNIYWKNDILYIDSIQKQSDKTVGTKFLQYQSTIIEYVNFLVEYIQCKDIYEKKYGKELINSFSFHSVY